MPTVGTAHVHAHRVVGRRGAVVGVVGEDEGDGANALGVRASIIARPDLVSVLDATAPILTTASSRVFSTRWISAVRAWISRLRYRVTARNRRTSGGGTNDAGDDYVDHVVFDHTGDAFVVGVATVSGNRITAEVNHDRDQFLRERLTAHITNAVLEP